MFPDIPVQQLIRQLRGLKSRPSEGKESMDWDTLTFAIRFFLSLEHMVLRKTHNR